MIEILEPASLLLTGWVVGVLCCTVSLRRHARKIKRAAELNRIAARPSGES